MKAKIKKTGQIIDVFRSSINDSTGVSYYAEKGTDRVGLNEYPEKELDFKDVIDWEQRRYEIAKDVLCAIVSNSNESFRNEMNSMNVSIYDSAVGKANILIERLKES